MVFSSTFFLFFFLPLVLLGNFLLKNQWRNTFLLVASLSFYAWGEFELVFLMMGSILMNYLFGRMISATDQRGKSSKTIVMATGISLNLLVLLYFKYAHFFLENLRALGLEIGWTAEGVRLPIGVSFFTFQNISYLADVYWGKVRAQKNIIRLGLYVSLFPQLIAGPIVRYVDIAKEIAHRTISKSLFTEGIIRFIRGLAKKVVIANTAAVIVDQCFALPAEDLSGALSWLAISAYALQIYFDFSGYSDMAIGLGKMLGFNFRENFLHPYIATSLRDFWRRWHISLSTWFRDYLYIPLGGNRKGPMRTYFNLLFVFFITGLWHGASWNFVIWGMFHGFFLLLERATSNIKIKIPGFFRHIYLILVVLTSWIFFRADSLEYAMGFAKQMFTFAPGNDPYPLTFLNTFSIVVLIGGILFSIPIRGMIERKAKEKIPNIWPIIRYTFYALLFVISVLMLAGSTYNPFIYFRF